MIWSALFFLLGVGISLWTGQPSLWATTVGMAIVSLVMRRKGGASTWKVDYEARPHHFVQALAQMSIYFYWAHFNALVVTYAPYILFQLVFATWLQQLVAVAVGRKFRVGFSSFPIVLSINLFIWARPDSFYFQLLMVGAAVLSKAFLVKRTDGRHVFNPSALVMAIAALCVLTFDLGAQFLTHDIVMSYMAVPHFYEFVFLVGCASHCVGRVAFISFGAVVALVAYDRVFVLLTSWAPMESMVHQSVFIGLTLLVTDPMTSPRSRLGQFLYGLLYGFGIGAVHAVTVALGKPRYYDKVLVVPLLNLIAPWLDKLDSPRWLEKGRWLSRSWAPSLVYGTVLVLLLPTIESNFYRDTYARGMVEFPPVVDRRILRALDLRWRAQCSQRPWLFVCERLATSPPIVAPAEILVPAPGNG